MKAGLVIKSRRHLPWQQLRLVQRQFDDLRPNIVRDPVPHPLGPGRFVIQRFGPTRLQAGIPAVKRHRQDTERGQGPSDRQVGVYSTRRMISSFSEPGYLIPRLPHPRSCFFEQTQFKRLLGNDLLQSPRLTAKVRHLAARGRSCRVACQPTFAGFEELLRPAVIKPLGDTFPAAQLGNARLATQAVQDNADLLFG